MDIDLEEKGVKNEILFPIAEWKGEASSSSRLNKDRRSLFMCVQEYRTDDTTGWVIKAINLCDLIFTSSKTVSLQSVSSESDESDESDVSYDSGESECGSWACDDGDGWLSDDDFASSDDDKSPEPNPSSIRQVGDKFDSREVHPFWGVSCCVFGSQILFAGGRSIGGGPRRGCYVFETDPCVDPKPAIKMQTCFKFPKSCPVLMQLDDGKLYAFAVGSRFEVLDPPPTGNGKWSALEDSNPPLSKFQFKAPDLFCRFCYATASTYIYLWTRTIPVYCYDASQPKKGWTKLSDKPLPCSPGTCLVVNNHGNNILFTYEIASRHCKLPRIRVYLMPDGVAAPFKKRIKKIASLSLTVVQGFRGAHRYSFVDLGGRQFCLVLSKFQYGSHVCKEADTCVANKCANAKMKILVVKFEYTPTATVSDHPSFKLHTLGTRILEYSYELHGKIDTKVADMLGVFLLPGGRVQNRNECVPTGSSKVHKSKKLSLKQNSMGTSSRKMLYRSGRVKNCNDFAPTRAGKVHKSVKLSLKQNLLKASSRKMLYRRLCSRSRIPLKRNYT